MLQAQSGIEKQWQIIPPSSFDSKHLAPPKGEANDHNRRASNASRTDSETHPEYRDNRGGSKNSSFSRRRSETERPLPRQVSAAFDDKESSNADSTILKLNRN